MNLDGSKTYLVSGLGIALAVAVNVFGVSIPGVAADPSWINHLVLPLLLTVTGRSALKKLGA